MFGKENKVNLDQVLSTYERLVMEFAAAIIQHHDYPFDVMDKQKFLDEHHQGYMKQWRYDLTIIEARRYADAFMAMED